MDYSHKKLQAHNAQDIESGALYGKPDFKRVRYNDRTLSVRGVRRIIRKNGVVKELAPAPTPEAKKRGKSPDQIVREAEFLRRSGRHASADKLLDRYGL